MKKLILILLLAVSFTSFSQERKGKERKSPEERVEVVMKKMTTDLNLNQQQQKEIQILLENQAKKREAKQAEHKARNEKGLKITDEEVAQMKKDRIDEQLEMKTNLKKILTEEQFNKWQELKKEHKKEFAGKRKAKMSGN
jgi:apolipoprotein N-acyltransferase